MLMVSPSCRTRWGPSATAYATLGSPTISALPIALVTRTRRVLEGTGWNAGGAGRDAPAGLADSTESRESRRAAPPPAQIFPEAPWLRVSRLRAFLSKLEPETYQFVKVGSKT